MEPQTQNRLCLLKIQNFEGPLDLLVHLIDKNKMNIHDIQMDEITDQYLEYIKSMQEMDLEIVSAFLVTAATLIQLKSRLLIPRKRITEETEEGVDPKEELLRRVLTYKKYKDFAERLKEREVWYAKMLYKMPEELMFEPVTVLVDLKPSKLKELYMRMHQKNLAKVNEKSREDMVQILKSEKVSLKSKIREVICALLEQSKITFAALFHTSKQSKLEVLTGFLAVLELAKDKKVELFQKENFQDIYIKRCSQAIDLLSDERLEREMPISSISTFD